MTQPINPVEPQVDAVPQELNYAKFKLSQKILLGTAIAYILNSLSGFFLVTLPAFDKEAEADQALQGALKFGGTVVLFIGLFIGIALFGLVYILMAKYKKAGRITGFVFAGLGIISALSNLQCGNIVVILISLVWAGMGIWWIITAANKEVSAVLK